MSEYLDVIFLVVILLALLLGYPVAITLGGVSVLFGLFGWAIGVFDPVLFYALPSRLFGIMTNSVLVAIPLFVFMGLVLERSRLAENMVQAAAHLFQNKRGGLAISVTIVGMLMAASTGIVGASVVTLGLLALPTLLNNGVRPSLAGGTVAAAGTLGQIIPPSIVLIVLGDQMSNAYQQMQTKAGNFAPDTVSVSDLFAGALLPGLILVALFVAYLWFVSKPVDGNAQAVEKPEGEIWRSFLPPLLLIVAVPGSILAGVATPSEAAAVGAVGALLLAWGKLDFEKFKSVLEESTHLISMIFLIVIGASIFSLVFRGLGGEETVVSFLSDLPGGTYGALLIVMLVIFVLGFFLDFLEITFVVVPLVAPVLLALPMADGTAMSPVWLGVLIALNLQTSFLTPPFGLSLFYLRSVAPTSVTTLALYRGIVPFVVLQLIALGVVISIPKLATFLPQFLYGQ
ncbi:MAG: TRAP transporter large permease subunit [Rhizobiaceae bacterium]